MLLHLVIGFSYGKIIIPNVLDIFGMCFNRLRGRWSWMRSMAEWAMSGRGRALAADVWRALALGTASVLGTARALHACDAVLQAGARRGGGAALAANLFSSLLIGVIGEQVINS